MTTIAVNLGAVTSSFDDLPIGSYLGEIAKAKLLPARQAGKFPQLMVSYLVIDGDLVGKRQSQFLSFSPAAAGFMKDFFAKFGLGDIPNLEFDDDDELTDPDIYGAHVIFKNVQDKKDAERIRVSLVSVEEWAGLEPEPSIVKPKPARASVEATVGRLPNQVEADVEEVADDPAAVKAAAKAARIAAAQAALEAAAAEDDDDDEPEEVVKAKPARSAAPRPAATAVADKPVRRTLR